VLVLVLAPVFTLVVISATWAYGAWHGRFFMPAVALSAATWGLVHRVRPVAWGLCAIAVTSLLLSFLHYREKPAGISLLEGTTSRSVWTADRLTVLSTWAPAGIPQLRLVELLEDLVEDGQTVALRLRSDNLSYPYFDPKGDRRTVFSGPVPPEDADWLIVSPGVRAELCPTGWRREFATEGWQLYRRVGFCR
jgi:hypothetical protein